MVMPQKFHGDDVGLFPTPFNPDTGEAAPYEAVRDAYAERIDFARAHPMRPQLTQSVQEYEHSLIGSLARACNIGRDMTVGQMDNLVAKDREFADRIVRLADTAPYRAGELRERAIIDKSGRKVSEFRGPKSQWMAAFQPCGVHVMNDPVTRQPLSIKTL